MKIIINYTPIETKYTFTFNDSMKNFDIIIYLASNEEYKRRIVFRGSEYDGIEFSVIYTETRELDNKIVNATNEITNYADESKVRTIILSYFMKYFKQNFKMVHE